ncbi:MAG: hypothetical protein LBR06_01860 [Bacteroidales bacterium]|jgi:uncharacterized iron-regulated protein|nr:hypothetical protein [Bacteroidales bacterium]
MNVKNLFFYPALIAICAGLFACGNDSDDDDDRDEQYLAVLNNYVESTVLPTYKALAEAALVMRTANQALKTAPSDAAMNAAADAWMAARIWWEKSEAFLFGPVGDEALSIDGHIDDWPLELLDIQRSIESGTVTTGAQAWELEGNVIGFHVTEYLLFRDGQPRPCAQVTDKELTYLTAATDALVWDIISLYVAWKGEDSVPTEMKTVFRENQAVVDHLIKDNAAYMNYAEGFKKGLKHSSLAAAVSEIFSAGGASGIAEEVGITKIQAPYNDKKIEDVESWYSWHSLDDYTNNILSIKNAYLGGTDDNTRTATALSTLVKAANAELDANIKAKIEETLTKIAAIGQNGTLSFYEVVKAHKDGSNEHDQRVDAAVDVCRELADLLNTISNIVY